MSANRTKDQQNRVNTRREIKPTDPDGNKGQRRVVRPPKKQRGKKS